MPSNSWCATQQPVCDTTAGVRHNSRAATPPGSGAPAASESPLCDKPDPLPLVALVGGKPQAAERLGDTPRAPIHPALLAHKPQPPRPLRRMVDIPLLIAVQGIQKAVACFPEFTRAALQLTPGAHQGGMAVAHRAVVMRNLLGAQPRQIPGEITGGADAFALNGCGIQGRGIGRSRRQCRWALTTSPASPAATSSSRCNSAEPMARLRRASSGWGASPSQPNSRSRAVKETPRLP